MGAESVNLNDIMILLGSYKQKLVEHDKMINGLAQQVAVSTWYMEFLTLKLSDFVNGIKSSMATEDLQGEFDAFIKVKTEELETMRQSYLKQQAGLEVGDE